MSRESIVFSFETPHKYFVATYYLRSKKTLYDAAWAIAIGQSIGNPSICSNRETDELLRNHVARILADPTFLKSCDSGVVQIAFPLKNIDLMEDGVSQLLCHVMGGNLDIDIIEECHLLNIDLPSQFFQGPKYGLSGFRQFTGEQSVLLGAIVKPKTGLKLAELEAVVGDMIEGGANFIKEDEIMSSPPYLPLEKRIKAISQITKNTNVIYSYCINANPAHVLDRARLVADLGGNSIHVNIWSGLGVYQSIRQLDLPLFLHFQKSGDRIFTNPHHKYHIKWNVICKLAGLMGADSIHAGMIGGYSADSEVDVLTSINTLLYHNVVPSLSCGMKPDLIRPIYDKVGPDWMATSGGWIHGYETGVADGLRRMKLEIDAL